MATLGNVPAEAYTNTVKDSFSGNGSSDCFHNVIADRNERRQGRSRERHTRPDGRVLCIGNHANIYVSPSIRDE